MHLPQDRLGIVRAGSAGKGGRRAHSQKQGLLDAMMAGSFELELNRIRVGKTCKLGGSCLIGARKDF